MNKTYVGHPLQTAGVEEYRMIGGKGDNMHFLQVRNGQGLDFQISVDRAADITRMTYQGMNMSYMSPCGYVAPAYYEREGFGFLNSFTCGFMVTCGFNNIGTPNTDAGENLGLHGTISHTPAEHIYYMEDDNYITIRATVRDGKIFNQKLVLHREFKVSKTENKIELTDTVENEGSRPEPMMLLYHMNMGYPLLDEHSILQVSAADTQPRDEHAAKDLDTWDQMLIPTPNFQEQCYYHTFDQPQACAKLYSPTIDKGMAMTFDTETLPLMTEWKMMGEKDYVLGLEPCNHYLDGRNVVREKGDLKYIKPGEKKVFNMALEFFDGRGEWENK